MKREVLSLAFALVAVFATAQINYGVHVGAGVNKVTNMDLPSGDLSFKSIVAPTAGVMASLTVYDWLDFQAELNYAMRGYSDKILYDSQELTADVTVRTSYLEIPVLAKVYPLKQSGLNLQLGPQVGYQFGRSVSESDNRVDMEQFLADSRRLDCAIVFGLGEDFGKWCIDLRYTLGLIGTYKDWHGYKNRGLSLSIGYYFN